MKDLQLVNAKPVKLADETYGYVSVQVPELKGTMIEDWLVQDCKFTKGVYAPNKMHCTLIYDDSNPITVKQVKINPNPHKAFVTGIDLFGKDEKVLVLTLHSPSLHRRNNELLNMGMKSSFDQYRPHITILSGATTGKLRRAISKLGLLLPFSLNLINEAWAPVDGDWSAFDDD